MNANDVRLLGIPRSRDTIASPDPQHDAHFRVPTPLEAGFKLHGRISVSRVWPRIHLEASRTCDGVDLPWATTPTVPLRTLTYEHKDHRSVVIMLKQGRRLARYRN